VLVYGKLFEFTHILTPQAIINKIFPMTLKKNKGDCNIYPAVLQQAVADQKKR
jgi:hypothetical protein